MSIAVYKVWVMPTYRFPPAQLRGHFFLAAGGVLLALGLPAILAAIIPTPEPEAEQVVLNPPGFDWEIPVPDLYCTPNADAMAMQAWDCGQVLVQLTALEDLSDAEEDTAARRAVRGYSMGDISEAEIFHEGNALALYDDPSGTLVLSRDGEGEDAKANYMVILSSSSPAQTLATGERIWHAFGHANLPGYEQMVVGS